MTMMPLLSVIVPIFGVEKYIERCARSLFSQTIDDKDIEFIFVNDCTKDSSIEVLQSVISDYPGKNISILTHTSNLGLPSARKTGVNAAQGEYIIHCDSDDWVEPDYCKKMYETALAQNADIVVCGYHLSDGATVTEDSRFNDRLLSDSTEAIVAAIALKSSPFVWNKMVKRTLYEKADFQFPNRFLAEDWALIVQLVLSAKKISVIDDKLYNYFINPTSMLREPTKEMCLRKIADEEENVRLVEEILLQRNLAKEYMAELNKRKAITKSMVFPFASDGECRRVWRKTFRESNWPILFNELVDRNYKRKHLTLLLGLYVPIRKLYNLILH